MKYIKKIIELKIIIIIFYLTIATPASAAGFVFNWEPFFVDVDLAIGNPSREVLIKDLSATDINMLTLYDFRDVYSLTPDQNKYSTMKTEIKSVPDNIKVILFPANTFITPRDKTYTNSDDEQVSRIINAMTSLIYGNSKIKSLETIGKIIEPQINFYFEF
jgi:hypothetical protein